MVFERATFQQELQSLQDEVLVLGQMVDRTIERSIEALKQRDLEEAKRIIQDDLAIDKKRFEIEEKCLQVIATQQPVAGDLRTIAAVLNIIVDLERMGDHAEGIGKINLMIGTEPLLKPLIDVPRMADKARDMLRRSLKAFMERDVEEARRICDEDDEVDALYEQVYRELLTYMLENPKNITRATHLLWVGHNLERIADRATNICERTVFCVTGQLEALYVSKY